MADRNALPFPLLPPGIEFAGYRIEEMIGRGGMGVVYRAVDSRLERRVALKVIAPEHTADPAVVARFMSEAKLAASIDHSSVLTIYAAGEYEGILFLAMQLVAGVDLRTVIAEDGALDIARIIRIGGPLASALDAAHALGLVHRDVKPANILLSGAGEDEHVYLTDFGLTKRLGAATGGLTRTGEWLGTPDYAAPEQIQGRDVDARTDVYSLGCVVHELLTGHRPYERDTSIATLWAHIADPPPSPRAHRSELLPVFDSFVARAMAKEPGERFPSAGVLSRALDEAVALQLAHDTQSPRPSAQRPATAAAAAGPSLPATAVEHTTQPRTPNDAERVAATPARPKPALTIRHRSRGSDRTNAAPATHRSWRARALSPAVAGGLLAAASVTAVLVIALSSGGMSRRSTTNSDTPAVLAQDTRRLNGIVQQFIAGKHLSHVEHRYTDAAENRTLVLRQLSDYRAPPQLRAAAQTLREMTADSLSFNLDMAAGKTALAHSPDNAHNALRPRFVAEFNPYAQRYLGRTYTIDDL